MRSVTNIQKITKAMKMVAASKMRVAQVSTEKARGLIVPLYKSLGDLPGQAAAPLSPVLTSVVKWFGCQCMHKLHVQPSRSSISDHETNAGADVENNVTVAYTSDKGLCGGINSTVTKYTRGVIRSTEGGAAIFFTYTAWLVLLSLLMISYLAHAQHFNRMLGCVHAS